MRLLVTDQSVCLEGEKVWACRNRIAPQAAATWGLLCPGLDLTVRHRLSGSACKVLHDPAFALLTHFMEHTLLLWCLFWWSRTTFLFHPMNFMTFLVPHFTCLDCGLCHLLLPDSPCSLQNIVLSQSKLRESFSGWSVVRVSCAFPCRSNYQLLVIG